MRKLILYIAVSLNGKIARTDGNVDWLDKIPNPKKTDYGYSEFIRTVDTTIQGYHTYHQLIEWGIEFPYKDKKNFVFTRKKDLKNTGFIEFISKDHVEFVKSLKQETGGDIWLIGGGQVNTMILNAGLLDEIRMFVMPVIIPDGIGIFQFFPNETQLQLVNSKSYSSGVVELNYSVV